MALALIAPVRPFSAAELPGSSWSARSYAAIAASYCLACSAVAASLSAVVTWAVRAFTALASASRWAAARESAIRRWRPTAPLSHGAIRSASAAAVSAAAKSPRASAPSPLRTWSAAFCPIIACDRIFFAGSLAASSRSADCAEATALS